MRTPCKTLYIRPGVPILVCACHYGRRPVVFEHNRVRQAWAEQ